MGLYAVASAQSAQELLNSVLNPNPNSTTYASYSTEIYYNATIYNQTTNISTNYNKLEASAKLRLAPAAYDYAAGGAGLEKTVAANREAFDKASRNIIHSLAAYFLVLTVVVAHCSKSYAPCPPEA
jgi:hypothetical protein